MINHKSGVGHLLSNFVSSLSGQAVRVNIQLSGSMTLHRLRYSFHQIRRFEVPRMFHNSTTAVAFL